VYVRTDDFRLAHHLLDELESLGISSGLLGVDEPLPEPDAWWFGTPDEVHRLGGRGVPVDVDEVKATVSKWSLTRRRESPPSTLTVGFDSGPRPGCAFLIDGQPMGTKETIPSWKPWNGFSTLFKHWNLTLFSFALGTVPQRTAINSSTMFSLLDSMLKWSMNIEPAGGPRAMRTGRQPSKSPCKQGLPSMSKGP
jgi:hypothetical protein